MGRQPPITQESFEQLLAWLHSDREKAGLKYEEIRQALIKIFTWNGVTEAEDLADETFNRVTKKVQELRSNYVGDPVLYFYGVAKKLLLEHRRLPHRVPLEDQEIVALPPENSPEKVELEYNCLQRCLRELSPNAREIILGYYLKRKQAKIDHRKELAEHLRIDANALRVRAYRIRSKLEKCIISCLETNKIKEL